MFLLCLNVFLFNFFSSLPSELFYSHLWPHLRVIRGREGWEDLDRGQTTGVARLLAAPVLLHHGGDQKVGAVLLPRAGLSQARLSGGPEV